MKSVSPIKNTLATSNNKSNTKEVVQLMTLYWQESNPFFYKCCTWFLKLQNMQFNIHISYIREWKKNTYKYTNFIWVVAWNIYVLVSIFTFNPCYHRIQIYFPVNIGPHFFYGTPKKRNFIFGIKEQWFTSSSYSILLKRNMKFNRSQYISNNHDKNITRSSRVPSELKKKMHLYLIYLLSIILQDLFLLTMGTLLRSKM